MDKYDYGLILIKTSVALLPIIYGLTTVYIPHHLNPTLYDSQSEEVTEVLSEHHSITMKELSRKTSMSYFQTWYVFVKMQKEEKALLCRNGLNLAETCPIAAAEVFSKEKASQGKLKPLHRNQGKQANSLSVTQGK